MKKYSKYIITLLCLISFLIGICFIPINASKLIPIIEDQVMDELGVNVHIEKLILRFGPLLKLKAPIVHFIYEDGHKFAQIDKVKFYITWSSLFKKNTIIKLIQANKLTVRVSSSDECLTTLLKNFGNKDFKELPDVKLKEYNFTFNNVKNNDRYNLAGQSLSLHKLSSFKSFKIKTLGDFSINNKKYISYDVSITPNFNIQAIDNKFDLLSFIEQIKDLDFNSDIIADLKLYKNSSDILQASGFINVDNISVLDIAKKSPKSFIYLTLWGDKASILSNLYTSANKKVYIDGTIINSKKPVLDVKVKTDEISLSELYKKIKIFTNLSQFNHIKSVDGVLKANFTLKGDLSKIKSNGFIKISDAALKAEELNINGINTDIDLSNNAINIISAVGYVNKSPVILKGSINKSLDLELLMNKVELKNLYPFNIGIKNGLISLIMSISGTFDNIQHKEKMQIDNLKISNDKVDINFDNLKYDTNKDNTIYIKDLLLNTKEFEQIKIPTLKLIVDSNNLTIPDTNIFMPNSKFIVSSNIANFNKDMNFVANLSGEIHSRDIKKLSQESIKYPVSISLNGNKNTQNITAQLFLEKNELFNESTIVNLNSKLEKNILKIDDLSLQSATGKLIDLSKTQLKGNKKIVITGSIENLEDPLLKNVRIFIPQLLNININKNVAEIKGDLFINGNYKSPEIIGQITLHSLLNELLQLNINNCTLDFNKNVAVINAPNIKLVDSAFGMNALISTDISEKLLIKNINIKSKFLNTDTLLMYKDNLILKNLPLEIVDGKFYAERMNVNLYNSMLYLMAFSGDLKLVDNILTIKNIASELFNGKITGTLKYNLKDEHYDTQIMARGISAEPIFGIISSRKDNISGIMDFDAALKGELTTKNSIIGNIKFIVNNGRMSSLGKLEHLLYAQNVIADNMLRTSLSVVTRAITLKDTGLFKYLRGDVAISDGIANINFLQSQGPLMALFIKGQYNLLNDYAKLVVLGRISDELVSGLGAFGDFSFNKLLIMLTGEENKAQVLPEDYNKIPQLQMNSTKEFRSLINGPIDKPSSVLLFNWIAYSKKSLKQKEVPMVETKVPTFVDELPY